MRALQQQITASIFRNSHLGNIIESGTTVTSTVSINAGQNATFSITTNTNNHAATLTIPDVTVYQGSILTTRQIPGGSSVTAADYQIIGPWNDYNDTDGENTVTKVYIANISNRAMSLSDRVSQSSDDGDINSSNSWSSTDANLLTGRSAGAPANDFTTGVRFQNVTIPKNSTINTATISFTGQTTKSATVATKIYGIAEDNTANFSSDPTGRTKTTNNVSWSLSSETLDVNATTPDLSAVVNEITTRSGWASGNAMGFLIPNNGSADNNFFSWWAYDGSTTKCPILIVTYTPPGSTQTVIMKAIARVISAYPVS